MSWRYQPVWLTEEATDNTPYYMLCRVHLDEDGRLRRWTDPCAYPSGDTEIGSLTQDICRMLVDAYSWEPVKAEEMRTGMVFKKKVTMKQREALAKFIESADHNLGEASA